MRQKRVNEVRTEATTTPQPAGGNELETNKGDKPMEDISKPENETPAQEVVQVAAPTVSTAVATQEEDNADSIYPPPKVEKPLAEVITETLEVIGALTQNEATKREILLSFLQVRIALPGEGIMPITLALGPEADLGDASLVWNLLGDQANNPINQRIVYAASPDELQKALKVALKCAIPALKKWGNEKEIHTPTLIIAYDEAADDPTRGTLRIRCNGGAPGSSSIAARIRSIQHLPTEVNRLAGEIDRERLQLSAELLPASPLIHRHIWRAFLAAAAIARWLDAHYAPGGFLDSIRGAWERTLLESPKPLENSLSALVAQYTLDYIKKYEPDYQEGFREDRLVDYMKEADEIIFGNFTETKLGRIYARLSVGSSGRHGFPTHIGNPLLVYRTYIKFSESDKDRLELKARELEA